MSLPQAFDRFIHIYFDKHLQKQILYSPRMVLLVFNFI